MGPECSAEGIFSIPKAEMCLQRSGVLGTLHSGIPCCATGCKLDVSESAHILNEIVLWFGS